MMRIVNNIASFITFTWNNYYDKPNSCTIICAYVVVAYFHQGHLKICLPFLVQLLIVRGYMPKPDVASQQYLRIEGLTLHMQCI